MQSRETVNFWIQHGVKARWHLFLGDSERSTCGTGKGDEPDDPTITEANPIIISLDQPDYDACKRCLAISRGKDRRWV